MNDANFRHSFARLDDVKLHYVEAGEGPLVVLLHGFPDFWRAWIHQIQPLAEAGFRVVAPDMRGYNESSKPQDVSDYTGEKLTGDVAQLVEHLGEDSCFLAGHDWGGAVAWMVPCHYPNLVERLMIFNMPHGARFMRGLRTLKQLRKSWYVGAFQLPWVPEKLASRNDFEIFRKTFETDPVNPDAFPPDELEKYVESWRRTDRLHGPINYYRAAARKPPTDLKRIDIPVRIVWGRQDAYLGEELAEPDPDLVTNFEIAYVDASHWVMHDLPERCTHELIDFFSAHGS